MNRQDRTKYLFVDDHEPTAIAIELEHSWPKAIAFATAAAQDTGASALGFGYPSLDASRTGLIYHRSAQRGRIERRLRLDHAGTIDHGGNERFGDRTVDVKPLDFDANLSRIPECTSNHTVERTVERPIAVDDYRGIAAEFKQNSFFSCDGFEVPSDTSAAGK
jgi:hypothetical protein